MKRILPLAFCALCFAASAHAETKDDVPALVKQLQDKDELVRLKAAKMLEKLGADAKDAIPALTDATNDPDDDVKAVARRAVAKIREALARSDKEAVKALLAGLEKDAKSNDKDTQSQAILGLAKLLRNDDDLIRAEAARSLADAGAAAKPVMKDLDQAAKDADPTVRKEARKALEALEAIAAEEAKAAVQQKLAPLIKDLKDPKASVKRKALEGLADMGQDAAGATEAVLELLADRSPAVQQSALDALEKVNPVLHKPILTLMVDRSSANKADAITSLGKMGADAKAAMPTLLRYYQLQLTAVDPSTFPSTGAYSSYLLNAMNAINPDDGEFQNDVIACASSGPAVVGKKEGNGAALKLQAISIMSGLVKDSHMDAAKAVKPLRFALSDPYCRLQAITALGDLGPAAKDALPELKQLKTDPDKPIREAAEDAVKRIE